MLSDCSIIGCMLGVARVLERAKLLIDVLLCVMIIVVIFVSRPTLHCCSLRGRFISSVIDVYNIANVCIF